MFNRLKEKLSSPQEGNDKKKKGEKNWQPSTNKVLRAMNPSMLVSHFKNKAVSKANKDAEVEINPARVGVSSTKKK